MDIEELHRVVVQGFASVTDRFDSADARLTAVEARLTEKIDSGLTAVNQRIDGVDAELGRVKDALMEHGRQLKDIRVALDRKVDRDELEARY